MPLNKHTLIRIKTIDKCLQNRKRRWTVDDLMQACSDALHEYEGSDKNISLRTLRADIALMRSNKLGYNAPIVIREKKYYTYEDEAYSITNNPLNTQDLDTISEAVEVLKQFKGFNHFSGLTQVVSKLEDTIYSAKNQEEAIIDFEKNENLKGLEYLDVLYKAIQQKQVLEILYQSYKSRSGNVVVFHPWLLKEFRNRWFVVGSKGKNAPVQNFALDRIQDIKPAHKVNYYKRPGFTAESFYKHVIGATVNDGLAPQTVKLFFTRTHAPYVLSKPLHHSQQLIERTSDGIIITLLVQPNLELEREILGFGDGVKVLWPRILIKRIGERVRSAASYYSKGENKQQ